MSDEDVAKKVETLNATVPKKVIEQIERVTNIRANPANVPNKCFIMGSFLNNFYFNC